MAIVSLSLPSWFFISFLGLGSDTGTGTRALDSYLGLDQLVHQPGDSADLHRSDLESEHFLEIIFRAASLETPLGAAAAETLPGAAAAESSLEEAS